MIEFVEFTVSLAIVVESQVRAFASSLTKVDHRSTSIGEAICAGVVNPVRPPEECGFTAQSSAIQDPSQPGRRWSIRIQAEINDPSAVVAEARERYVQCWNNPFWYPGSLSEAVYEILIASNASPAPVDIGLNLFEMNPLKDVPLSSIENVETMS